MAELHVHLRHEVAAFDFRISDVAPLSPILDIVWHDATESFIAGLVTADYVATWDFESGWYDQSPRLKGVFTPAAGFDWVAHDPRGLVSVHHGTFHGPLMAESLIGAILFVNRRIPAVLANEAARGWDRDFQASGSMLRNQRAVIVGYGSIGRDCARLLRAFGMTTYGVQRSVAHGSDEVGAILVRPDELPRVLGEAEHVICLLPGIPDTDGYFTPELFSSCRGAHFYNFGRGNVVSESVLASALDAGHLTSAVLDVTEPEPLPATSALWADPRVLVMPHSSAIYQEYRPLYIEELSCLLPRLIAGTS